MEYKLIKKKSVVELWNITTHEYNYYAIIDFIILVMLLFSVFTSWWLLID